MARKVTLPLTEELAKTLHAGDQVLLTGTIYTSSASHILLWPASLDV